MKKLIVSFAALVLFMACEKEIPIKQEEKEPRIVVNSIFSAGDTIWINLSESRDVLYNDILPNIENATAKLLDASDNEIASFTHVTDGNYYCADPTPVASTTYGLRVEAAGFKSITASAETPSIISLSSIDTTFVGIDQLEFNLSFTDDASQDNYYGISIVFNTAWEDEEGNLDIAQSPYFSTKEVYVINGDPDIDGTRYAMEFFFSDNGFNGQTINFTGRQYMWGDPEALKFFVVGLKSLSEDLYKYKLSYSKYLDAQGDFFAEPVQVYSNITDGFGIFGGSSTHRDTVWVE
ncbi:MAG: DUF4249 family protein [Crocinitomix sp.]|nr:DUF4249 family protein [Crocinitomix sp.]